MIHLLRQAIETGRLLGPNSFAKLQDEDRVDDLLDHRDEPYFEDPWVRVHGLLADLKGQRQAAADHGNLREQVFQKVQEHTGHHELAASVSDDFELFADALQLDFTDPWLSALGAAYAKGEIPDKALSPKDCKLAEALVLAT